MRMLQLFCCAMVLSSPAQAAIYEYRYKGQPLEIDSGDRDRLGDLPEIWRAYNGVIRLDEDQLSRKTLINSNLYFSSMWVG